MRIAFISYWSCPLTRLGVLSAGGMSVYINNIASQLGQMGCKVDIYTRVHKEKERLISLHKNVSVIHLKEEKERLFNYIKNKALTYDLIHSHYYYSGKFALSLKNKLKIPMIMTYHTLGIAKQLYLGIKDKKRILFEKEIAQVSDGIIVSTSLEKDDLIKHYSVDTSKIFMIAPGVNHQIFRPKDKRRARKLLSLPYKKKIILFVGRIDPIKGIRNLLRVISMLTQKYTYFSNKFQVLLIGGDIKSRDFWQTDEVMKIREQLVRDNLECCVKFVGSQPHYLLPFYYSASDVVVLPSLYESFGLVVLEALACGSPVLSSKVGGATFLIKDKVNGRIFESNDLKNFAQILWELLCDKEQREKLGRNGLNESQKYSWEIQAKKILSVYRKFL